MKIQIITKNKSEYFEKSINNYFLKGHEKTISENIDVGFDFYYFFDDNLEIVHYVGEEILDNVIVLDLVSKKCNKEIDYECFSIDKIEFRMSFFGGKYDFIKNIYNKPYEIWKNEVLDNKFKILSPSYCHPELNNSIFPKKIVEKGRDCYKEYGLRSSWWDKNFENISFIEKWGDFESPIRKFIQSLIEKAEISSILDLGCGFCHENYTFVGKKYKGIDNSLKIVNFTKDLGIDIEFGDIEEYKDEKFDMVYIKDVLEYLSYYEKSIKNAIDNANKCIFVIFSINPSKKEDIRVADTGIYSNVYDISKIDLFLSQFNDINWKWKFFEGKTILFIGKNGFDLDFYDEKEVGLINKVENKNNITLKNKKSLIISRYKEDISWIDKLDDSYVKFIYNKFEGDNLLPNIGRERHTYLHYIVENYDNLNDINIFTQGNPFDHCKDFYDRLDKLEIKEGYKSLVLGSNYFNNKGHPPILAIDRNGEMNRMAHYIFDEILCYNHPFNVVYAPFALFAVDKNTILRRNKYFYLRLLYLNMGSSDMKDKEGNKTGPYVLERMWQEIFTIKDDNSIIKCNKVNEEWWKRNKLYSELYGKY
jgi:SAM-dependent methyltransferase